MRIEVSVCRLCLLSLSLALIRTQGADFYVSTQGNDTNPGSSGQPFRTITRAYRVAGGGGTIHVLPRGGKDYSSGGGGGLGGRGGGPRPLRTGEGRGGEKGWTSWAARALKKK